MPVGGLTEKTANFVLKRLSESGIKVRFVARRGDGLWQSRPGKGPGSPVRPIELVDPEPKWIGGRYGVVGYEALHRTESAV